MVIVIAECIRNSRQLAAMIFKSGTINLGNGKGLKITPKDKGFVKIQVLDAGIGKQVDNQSYIRTPVTAKAKKKEPITLKVDETVNIKNAFGD